jgi:hypothetical protein
MGGAGRARGVLADLGRHRADEPSLRPARGPGHDPRGGPAEGVEG